MKKWMAGILIAAVVFSMAGCIPTMLPKTNTSSSHSSESSKDSSKTFGLNEAATLRHLQFQALQIKESYGGDFTTPHDGKVFVGVQFEILNTSEQEQSVSTLLLFDAYVDDVKCEYSFSANMVSEFDGTLDGSLAPGKKMIGWYAVEVPENWKTLELDVKSGWLSSGTARFVFQK